MSNKDHPSGGTLGDPRLARAIDSAEVERRLAGLEDTTKKLEDHATERRFAALEDSQRRLEITQTDRNLRTISIVFGAMVIAGSILAWGSKTDTRDAIKDMQRQFDLLAGDALKKPSLQIMWDQRPLDSQVIEILVPNVVPSEFSLGNFFLSNTGDRRTEPLSISLLMKGRVVAGYDHQDWQAGPSADKDYMVGFYSTRDNATVAAKQTSNVHPLTLIVQDFVLGPTNIPCKMQVYYGGDRSAEARFQLKFMRQ